MILAFLDFLKYVLLGLVQGITEPLPISSSGHLVIFKNIFGVIMNDELNFNIFVNFGSLIAIILYYRLFLKEIIVGAFRYLFKKQKEYQKDFIYIMLVIVATIPAGIAGLLLKDLIDSALSTLLSVAVCLLITGGLLLFIQAMSKRADQENITLKTAILMGVAQIFGLLPGISRSGVTTSFGVANKAQLEKALRFSFMMYIPVSFASLLLGILDIDMEQTFFAGYIGAFLMSIIGTFLSIHFFFKLVRKNNLKYFGYYCLLVSLAIFIYLGVTA